MLLTNVAKDNTILGRRYLHVGLDIAEVVWRQHNRMWSFDQFQIAKCRQFECTVLQRIAGLVDDQDVQHDVVLVDMDVCLGVDGVGEARQLCDLIQFAVRR